jgi:hypothetical protein
MQNPDNVVNKLEPKLSVLFKLQEFLASFKPYDANEASALGPTQADVMESERNALRLKTIAEKVVSRAATVVSGSTVYEQSVADPQDLREYQQARLSR